MLVVLCHPARATQTDDADPLFGTGDEVAAAPVSDPLEPFNRLVFRFNTRVDHWLLDPVSKAYDLAVPAPARRAVRRAIANLDAPSVFVNDVLQLEPVDAGTTVSRFVINTMFGCVGLLDIAELLGLEAHSSDFGQTLALYGMPSGPFLILPILGPTTLRDTTGYLVDFWFRPTTYLLSPAFNVVVTSIRDGSAGFVTLNEHAAGLDRLEASSMDFYAALRSAYVQERTAAIWRRRAKDVSIANR